MTGILAHGIGGRIDLPVPRWLFVYGAATAVVISFVALAVLWREPRLQQLREGRALPAFLERLLTSRLIERILRWGFFGLFVILVVGALTGSPQISRNIVPVFVYVWFWIGLAFLHAIFGNLWATISPFDTIGRLMGLERARRPYPKSWGKWPAAFLLLGFVWMELVDPSGATPRSVGAAMVVYTVLMVVGMAVFGRKEWLDNGDGFGVYFGLLSRIAPFDRDRRGRVVVRPVLGGLPSLPPQPGLIAFVMVLLGSTTFDGASRSNFWQSLTGSLTGAPELLAGTAGLLAVIGAVALAYTLAMSAAGAITRSPWHPLAVRFVHSLVPIAFAYVVAHYFSLLVIEGQQVLVLMSDPFGLGFDLFGTASWSINLGLVSATTIWYVQVTAIVAGHVGGVVLAHDRAIAIFPQEIALRTQYALLAVMVLFTITGLLILSG
ncbi:MAG: hypothetical protein WD276_01315 [Actinomycetota bacterium]